MAGPVQPSGPLNRDTLVPVLPLAAGSALSDGGGRTGNRRKAPRDATRSAEKKSNPENRAISWLTAHPPTPPTHTHLNLDPHNVFGMLWCYMGFVKLVSTSHAPCCWSCSTVSCKMTAVSQFRSFAVLSSTSPFPNFEIVEYPIKFGASAQRTTTHS